MGFVSVRCHKVPLAGCASAAEVHRGARRSCFTGSALHRLPSVRWARAPRPRQEESGLAAPVCSPPGNALRRLQSILRGFPNPGAPNSDGRPRLIEELVQFPTHFEFKVIGLRQGEFAEDVTGIIVNVLRGEWQDDGQEIDYEERVRVTRVRDKGKYRSLTVRAFCESGAQVYSVYDALARDPRVIFKL